jgi:Secretion system C-terminal sorting domain
VYIIGNPSGINFSIVAAAAQVTGTVSDELGNPIPGPFVGIANSFAGQLQEVQGNVNGVYQIGLTQSDLNGNSGFAVSSFFEGNNGTNNLLDAMGVTGTIAAGDSVVKNLVAYTANSTISGTVTVNGAAPGYPIQLAAQNVDSGQSVTWSNSSTGAFSFPVTNKIFNYTIYSIGGLTLSLSGPPVVHPGQSGVIVNFTTTAVSQSSDPLPRQWSLKQNYPNPFNPTTNISFSLPQQSKVRLTVINILGQVVATLVNGEQRSAGNYTVTWNAESFASGVYFCRLQAGSFVQTRKLILLK